MTEFINPYTFVPLHSPQRRRPRGHTPSAEAAGELLSGRITLEVAFDTPLLLPTDSTDAPGRHQGWLGEDGGLRVPGSSVKGAVRAVHEAAFDGCMRIVDTEFTPSYRVPAKADVDAEGWTLAVVTRSVGGRPMQFQVCDPEQTVWVDAVDLKRAWPGPQLPTSGDIVDIVGDVEDTTLNRFEVRAVRGVTLSRERGKVEQEQHLAPAASSSEGPDWRVAEAGFQVFLVTDTAARPQKKRDRTPGRCLWANSVLLDTLVDFDPKGADKEAYAQFWRACLGSNDRRQLEGDAKERRWRREPRLIPVTWRTRQVARRAAQTGLLFRGDVVWVQWRHNRIDGIRLAQLWRYTGHGSVGSRLGQSRPCLTDDSSDDTLCLSCEIFGAADAGSGRGTSTTTPGSKARQRSYAGHVRFGALTSDSAVAVTEVELAPLSTPNPGSGAFYLDLDSSIARNAPVNEIATHWGSSTDRRARTPIRGRKFYWHSDPDAQARHWATATGRQTIPRYQATPEQVTDPTSGQRRKTARKATLVHPGTVVRGVVTFDNLPAAYVASLLASLDPKRLLPPGDSRTLATHLGGGKPLGLGTASVTLTCEATSVPDRYAVAGPPSAPVPDLHDPEVTTMLEDRAGAGWKESQRILAQVLDTAGLGRNAHLVAYPPGAPSWEQFGTQPFRESFAFFQATNGQRLARFDKPLSVLPPAGQPNQQLRINLPRKRGRA